MLERVENQIEMRIIQKMKTQKIDSIQKTTFFQNVEITLIPKYQKRTFSIILTFCQLKFNIFFKMPK